MTATPPDPSPEEGADAPRRRRRPERSETTSRLVRGAQQGATDDFAQLYRKIAPAIFAWANMRLHRTMRAHIEPEEFVQEVWCRALARFHTYDLERAPFRVWVFRIANNTMLEFYRKVTRRLSRSKGISALGLLSMEEVPDEASSVSRKVSRHEGLRAFLSEVEDLAEADRQLLLWRGLEGLSHAEVAARLDISVDAVSKRWQRLRARFESGSLPEAFLAGD